MAYEIDGARDGIYQIIVFEAPSSAVAEVERVLLITEEVLRHLVIRDERKGGSGRDDLADGPVGPELDEDEIQAAAAASSYAAQGE